MKKTIDTAVATKAMIELFENHYGSSRLSFFKTILAILEAAPAVEPAHKYTSAFAGNVVAIYKDGEQMTIEDIVCDLNTKAIEPGLLNACLSNVKQEPAQSAIPAELREVVLELCELTLINGGPCGMVTAAMMQRAKQIREMMETDKWPHNAKP